MITGTHTIWYTAYINTPLEGRVPKARKGSKHNLLIEEPTEFSFANMEPFHIYIHVFSEEKLHLVYIQYHSAKIFFSSDWPSSATNACHYIRVIAGCNQPCIGGEWNSSWTLNGPALIQNELSFVNSKRKDTYQEQIVIRARK